MKIAFYTLGCKVNQYETQSMREKFAEKGHSIVSADDSFDCIIINSCTVTAESDRKTRQQIGHFKREHPNSAVVLTGCMAQNLDEKTALSLGADVVTGNTDLEKIVTLTERFFETGERQAEIHKHLKTERFNTPKITEFAEHTRAFMKIEDGCERYCTYCVIPYARGFVRSKPIEDIKAEAKALIENGYSEIVLVGINLSAYGSKENLNLCDAVDAVCSVKGIKRVRLSSLEPDHISDDMLKRFKEHPEFCPQFHLSLQSGCDATLKRMNRHYDTAFYADLVGRIRKIFPDAAISTDIMVGFPGETEEEFSQSLEFLKKIAFSKSHVFAYSRRSGTVADKMPDQVTKAVKSERSKKMIAAARFSELNFLNSQIGKEVSVLFETFKDGKAQGYTPNYVKVKVNSEKSLAGSLLTVKITGVNEDCCEGVLI